MSKQKYPEPACGALIFNKENKVLLIKSHKWKNKYVIPGGHVELGETLIDTLKREIKEETGLIVYDIKFICFQEFIFDNAFYKEKHFIFFDYACKTKSINVKLNSEGQEFVWLYINDALKLAEPYTKTTIQKYLRLEKNEVKK